VNGGISADEEGFVTDDVYAEDNEWDAVEDDGVVDASDTWMTTW
jgi:hypothetical protein